MRIAIDLDKTIFSCPTPLYKLLNLAPPLKPPFSKLKYTKLQETKEIIEGKRGINRVNNKKYIEEQNAIQTIKKWHDQGHKIILLSSRPSIHYLNEQVLDWLSIQNLPYDEVIVGCNNKASFCTNHNIDLLIDNQLSICKKTQCSSTLALRYNWQEFSWKDIDDFCGLDL